jgi:hypothetical protein
MKRITRRTRSSLRAPHSGIFGVPLIGDPFPCLIYLIAIAEKEEEPKIPVAT